MPDLIAKVHEYTDKYGHKQIKVRGTTAKKQHSKKRSKKKCGLMKNWLKGTRVLGRIDS